MATVTRPNGSNYFASHPSIDPDLGALIDAELNILFSGMNSIDNANIDGTPKIDASKIDLTSGGYIEDTGDEITGILQHIFDTVSGQSFWRAMRASGNARIYEGVADGLWCISQNTFYTGSAWNGRDVTGVCWALKLESDGFHVYYAVSASSGVVPSWTEVLYASATGLQAVSYQDGSIANSKHIDFAAGNRLIHNNSPETTSTNPSYVKAKEILLTRGGTYRVKFDLRDAVGNGKGKIYRNGSPVGTEQTQGNSYATKSEDIGGWTAGDLLQLYAHRGTDMVYVRNLQLYVSTPEDAYNDKTIF